MSLSNELKFTLSQELFLKFVIELEKSCGILLAGNKKYLVESRLNPLVKELGFQHLNELIQIFLSPIEDKFFFRQTIVDAMTTNETLWFRDGYPFDFLKNTYFKNFSQQTSSTLRVWSAACSTGQEPYSISMIFDDAKKMKLHTIPELKIIATDISKPVVEKATEGNYEKIALSRGMSNDYLQQFFKKTDTGTWRVKDTIRAHVEFKIFNLLDRFEPLGKFDIIFCRNVLIYFSPHLKEEIMKKMHASLKPEGILFLGSSESIASSQLFKMENANPGIVYRKK